MILGENFTLHTQIKKYIEEVELIYYGYKLIFIIDIIILIKIHIYMCV